MEVGLEVEVALEAESLLPHGAHHNNRAKNVTPPPPS